MFIEGENIVCPNGEHMLDLGSGDHKTYSKTNIIQWNPDCLEYIIWNPDRVFRVRKNIKP